MSRDATTLWSELAAAAVLTIGVLAVAYTSDQVEYGWGLVGLIVLFTSLRLASRLLRGSL